jgi:FAD/FMN-containing dehydrogenase
MSHGLVDIAPQNWVISMSLNKAYAEFVDILGHENVLREADEILPYSICRYSRSELKPALVLKPTSVQQLSRLLPAAQRYGLSVTPRGSGFDSAMGSLTNGGILIDLTGLNHVLKVDEENCTITVQSGATFESIAKDLASKGLSIGLEPIASLKATIGGFIASHGVGYGSLRHGSILNTVREIEVVLSDGSIVRTGFKGIPPGGTGYDLSRLMVGSEGLFGIITEATLEIFPLPELTTNIASAFSDIEEGRSILKEILKKASTLSSMYFFDEGLIRILQTGSFKIPYERFIGMVRLEGVKEVVTQEVNLIETIYHTPLHPQVSEQLWNHRFLHQIIETLKNPVLVDEHRLPTDKNVEAYRTLRDLAAKNGVKSAFYSLQTSLDSNLVIFIVYGDDLGKVNVTRKEIEDAIISLGGKPYTAGFRRAEAMRKASPALPDMLIKIKRVLDGTNLFGTKGWIC